MTESETFNIRDEILDEVESWCALEGMQSFEVSLTIGSDCNHSELEVTGTREQLTFFKLRWA
jgi:hypothetical protein